MVSVYSFCIKACRESDACDKVDVFLDEKPHFLFSYTDDIYKITQRLYDSEIDFSPLNCVGADWGDEIMRKLNCGKLRAGFHNSITRANCNIYYTV